MLPSQRVKTVTHVVELPNFVQDRIRMHGVHALLSVMAGFTVRKVDVAQWVDDRTFLYMDIRLRHQRNETTVGRWFLHIC
jgi:hypothetical protein